MMKFAQPTKPAPVSNRFLLLLSYGLGLLSTGLALAQMASFEDFASAIQGYHVIGYRTSLALAIVLLGLEVFSVPFWFRLNLSLAARWASVACAILAPYVWVMVFIAVMMHGPVFTQSGLLGGLIHVPFGLAAGLIMVWAVVVSVSLGTLAKLRALRGQR